MFLFSFNAFEPFVRFATATKLELALALALAAKNVCYRRRLILIYFLFRSSHHNPAVGQCRFSILWQEKKSAILRFTGPYYRFFRYRVNANTRANAKSISQSIKVYLNSI